MSKFVIVNDSRCCAGQRLGALRGLDLNGKLWEASPGRWDPLEDYKLAK